MRHEHRPGLCSLWGMRRERTALAVLAAAWLSASAQAMPRSGEPFPRIAAEDLTGKMHDTGELVGHRTLVIAIVDQSAAEPMRNWYQTADTRMAANIERKSLIS